MRRLTETCFASLLLPVFLLFAGCVPMRYSEYHGLDASSFFGTWPTGPGTMVETSFSLPVYRGWPEKPYCLLGSLSFPDVNKNWDEGIVSAAAGEAKHHKADAIIIRQGAEFGVSKIAGAKNDPWVLWSTYQTTALAVRWLTQSEVQEHEKLVTELNKRLALEHHLVANQDVGWLIVMFLVQSGYDPHNPEFFTRFAEAGEALGAYTPDSIAGDWIFKAALSASTFLSSGDDRLFLGTAKVSVDGDNVAIVSTKGRIEINFSGTLVKGRLSGQLGVGQVSAKCDGAATSEKLSISFQSLTPDGTVRGNVVLQRLPPKQGESEMQRLPFKPKDNEKAKPNSAGRSA